MFFLFVVASVARAPKKPKNSRTIRTDDQEPPKPYAQYDLKSQRRPNITHSVIWRARDVQTLRAV